jgi:hypothetical protein
MMAAPEVNDPPVEKETEDDKPFNAFGFLGDFIPAPPLMFKGGEVRVVQRSGRARGRRGESSRSARRRGYESSKPNPNDARAVHNARRSAD